MTPEFHRPLPLEHIGLKGLYLTVEATPPECSALAVRMNLPAVLTVLCTFRLTRDGWNGVLARGVLRAKVRQTCVVSLDEVDGVPTVTSSELEVRGRVAGLDGPGFEAVVGEAAQLCPISRLFAGARVTFHAQLELV